MLGSVKRRLIVGGAVVLLLVTAIPGYMLVRSHVEGVRLARMLRGELAERLGCPVPEPFVERSAVVLGCWDGKLPSGRAFILIFGTEPGSRAQVANYIGIWLPPGPDLTDAWLTRWKERVAARGDFWAERSGVPAAHRTHLFVGPPESEPIRADRAEDGVLIAWRLITLPSADKVRERIAAVAGSF
jgi:hypothetical protein